MQVEFLLAGEITQVKELLPWVRCASGNVFSMQSVLWPNAPIIGGVGSAFHAMKIHIFITPQTNLITLQNTKYIRFKQ